MSDFKDYMGHILEKGDWVVVKPPDTFHIGKIIEVSGGGIISGGGKNQQPAKIRLILDITIMANPNMPIFNNLVKTLPPGSDDMIDKIMESANKPPTPGSVTQ